MAKILVFLCQAGTDYYVSFQNTDGDVLAESIYYQSEQSCREARDHLVKTLENYAQKNEKVNPFRCGSYYYCALRQGGRIILRCTIADTKEGSLKIWDQLMACVREGILDFDHTDEKSRMTLHLDPRVINYMYSLDGQGRVNFLNYTTEVQWEDPHSWLWNSEKGQALYHLLFQRMARSHPTDYMVQVRTGDVPYAGTDAKVFIKFHGSNGVSPLYELSSGKDAFAQGRTTLFGIHAQENFGTLEKITISHDDSGLESEWYLQDVRVMKGDKVWYFPCGRWLYRQQEDEKNVLTLDAKPLPACEHTYSIRIRTGDFLVGPGTDANVYVTLYGARKKSQEYKLDSAVAHFEKGSDDTFRILVTTDLGKLERLRIRHDNTGLCPSWYVEDVHVTNETTGGSWNFPCGRWLDQAQGDRKIDWMLAAGPGSTNEHVYAVRVQTGEKFATGTAAKVYITLHGTRSSSQEYRLDTFENDFKKGKLDTFRICTTEDLGPLTRIRIRHDNSLLLPGWFLDEIRIEEVGTKNSWHFPCDRWLHTGKDDKSIDRTLDAVPEGMEPVRYAICLRTGDVKRAGTGANVYVTLHGSRGNSGEYRLDASGNDFEKGGSDTFHITLAKELGELEKVRVRHDNSGFFPAWYLQDVRVTIEGTEKSWYFPCDRWLNKKDNSTDVTLEARSENEGGEAI